MEINLRKAITRTLTISNVTLQDGETITNYTVLGETTPIKELKKHLKEGKETIPTISVETITEKRAITVEDFIKHSVLVENLKNESEEN